MRSSLAFLLLFGLLFISSSFAEEEKDEPVEVDRYAVPEDADVPALVKFVEELKSFRPKTAEEARNHQRQSSVAIRITAEKILKLEKDPKSDAYVFAKVVTLGSEVRSLIAATPEERKEFLREAQTVIESGKPDVQKLQLAMQTANILESVDQELAINTYETFGKVFAESPTQRIADNGKLMVGAARRLQLPGHPLELKGKTFDGKDFELGQLKGKVVLIDFWATWCGPCIAEIPNMKKLYSEYHDQGFEIVGLSLDQDRTDLEEFLEARELPWTILHDEENEGKHPAATHYGVFGIPTMILVGKDGNVLDIHARGAQLKGLLAKQFPETAAEVEEKAGEKKKAE